MSTTKNKKTKGRPKHFSRGDALSKALQVFCESGYEAASIAQLGEAMNMKPPSLYNAFGDKEGLFTEVLEHYHKPYMGLVTEIFARPIRTTDAIKAVMDESMALHSTKSAKGCLVVNSSINVTDENSPITQKIKALHEEIEHLIVQRLEQGIAAGDIPKTIEPLRLARYLSGILKGAAVIARGQQSPAAVKDTLELGYEGFLRLVSTNHY